MLSNSVFLALVLGLPIAVSVQLFRNEPSGRPFLATYALAVIESSTLFIAAAFVLMVTGIDGLGPFDGIFEVMFSVPLVLIVGLIVRRHRTAL